MATPTAPCTPYTPTSEADALSAAFQITGDHGEHLFDGDWHHALTTFSHQMTTPVSTHPSRPNPHDHGLEALQRARTAIAAVTRTH